MQAKNVIVAIIVAALVAIGIVIARNRPNPDQEAVQYRQALMTVIDFQMQPLVQMQQGQRPLDPALLRAHAAHLAMLAGMIPEAFQRNTSAAKLDTAALPYVWSASADFQRSVQHFQSATQGLEQATQAAQGAPPTSIRQAIGRVEGQCEQCHRSFRSD